MILLPASIPRPQRGGYTLTVTGATTVTTRDGSQVRQRRTAMGSRTEVDLTWILTPAQFATFAAWWRYDLAEGSLEAGIQLPNGTSDEIERVQFTGPYAASDLAGRWRVTARLEMTSPYRLTADMVTAIISGADSLESTAFHSAVHHAMPSGINP